MKQPKLDPQQGEVTMGVIAGKGIYPELFIQAARLQGVRLILAAFKNETREHLADQVEAVEWFHVGQLGKMIKFFQNHQVKQAVMMGQIAPKNLYDLRPDLRVMKILALTKKRNAETLFGAIAEELSQEGITLLPATTYLEDCLPKEGFLYGPKINSSEREDLQYGFEIAKEMSRLDIGQTVIVREGTVLAVEAFEGTNACIRRGGELGKKKGVKLVKVAKPNQDFRFDVPVIGPDTIRHCAESGVHSIGIEANKTLILDRKQVQDFCKKHKVSLYALASENDEHA